MAPSSEAGRELLIRRLSLDLLGLLPSPEEVRHFVEDKRPDAYERLVDRLLALLRYGENGLATGWIMPAMLTPMASRSMERVRSGLIGTR